MAMTVDDQDPITIFETFDEIQNWFVANTTALRIIAIDVKRSAPIFL
jgi:hypothetical protein